MEILKTEKCQLSEQLVETENTLNMLKTDNQECRLKNNELNAVLNLQQVQIQLLMHKVTDIESKNTDLKVELSK